MLYVGLVYTGLGISLRLTRISPEACRWKLPSRRYYLNINLELSISQVYTKVKYFLKLYLKLSNGLVLVLRGILIIIQLLVDGSFNPHVVFIRTSSAKTIFTGKNVDYHGGCQHK